MSNESNYLVIDLLSYCCTVARCLLTDRRETCYFPLVKGCAFRRKDEPLLQTKTKGKVLHRGDTRDIIYCSYRDQINWHILANFITLDNIIQLTTLLDV